MDMILLEVVLKNIHSIPQDQIYNDIIYFINSAIVIYLLLWNQVDALQKHFKRDHVHIYAPLDEALRYIFADLLKIKKCLIPSVFEGFDDSFLSLLVQIPTQLHRLVGKFLVKGRKMGIHDVYSVSQ